VLKDRASRVTLTREAPSPMVSARGSPNGFPLAVRVLEGDRVAAATLSAD
jgi:hypothetical protein